MPWDPDDLDAGFDIDDSDFEPTPRSRAVRWTAILVVASFAIAGLASLFRWF